jgi:hypothetical protein
MRTSVYLRNVYAYERRGMVGDDLRYHGSLRIESASSGLVTTW